jgi:hypothetical protein
MFHLVGSPGFDCLKCGSELKALCDGEQPKPEPQPVPESDWPAWAKLLAARKSETDKGVGDTFQRLAASMGGELFKKLAKSMGLPCGCDARQADWNRLYPYI